MINWSDIKRLEKQKNDLQLKLNELLNSNNNINEIKAQIIVLDIGIGELLRINEVEIKQILDVKGNKKCLYELKDKYKKLSKLKISITKMLDTIEKYENKEVNVNKKL